MGLEVHEHPRGEERRTTVGLFVAKAKLWLNADKSEVVEDGHPDAAHLFASVGTEIPIKEAERYGLVGTKRKPVKAKTPAGEDTLVVDDPALPQGEQIEPADYAGLDGKALKAELKKRGIEFKPVGVKLDVYREQLVADDAAKAAE